LIELVVTILIIGILAATLAPRWSGNSGFDERSFRDRTVSAIRYAQKSAVAARRTVCVAFVSPVQVDVLIADFEAPNCVAGRGLIGPDGQALIVSATGGASFSAIPADIVFDAAGRPGVGSNFAVNGLDPTLAIIVEAETGYVH
jgi:MSHA pilin protein MshC